MCIRDSSESFGKKFKACIHYVSSSLIARNKHFISESPEKALTIDDDRKTTMDISTPYMENKQVMVAKSDVADKIKSADDLKDKTVVRCV